MNTHSDRRNESIIIHPTQVEEWISGIRQVKIAADDMVSVLYENGCEISARLEFIPHAIQANFFALVRRVQNAAMVGGQKTAAVRLV